MKKFIVVKNKIKQFNKTIRVSGDKSISIRWVLFSSIAEGVSTAKNLKAEAQDDNWKLFPAKLIQQTQTDVLPIYFDGKNGLMFHLFASKIKNQTLKYSSYIYETRKKICKEITIYSGNVIKYEKIARISDRKELIQFLKDTTYNLKI